MSVFKPRMLASCVLVRAEARLTRKGDPMRHARVSFLLGMALATLLVRPVKAAPGTVNSGATGNDKPAPSTNGTSPTAAPASVKNVGLWPDGRPHRFEFGELMLVNVEHLSALAKP